MWGMEVSTQRRFGSVRLWGGDKVLNYKQICKYDESVVLEDQSYTVGTRGVLGQCNCNGQIETNMGPD